MGKIYERIKGDNGTYGWEDFPSDNTSLNARRLNHMDVGIDENDTRIAKLDEIKASKDEVAPLIADVDFDEKTGTFTFIRKDSVKYKARIWDTKLEQLVENLDFDEEAQELIIIRADGGQIRVDVSAFVKPNEFLNSDTAIFQIEDGGKVSVIVKEGSIQEKHLRPDYLADIKIEQGKAQSSAEKSEEFAKLSESYAHGGTGTRPDEDSDNAMAYAEKAKEYSNDWKGSLLPQGTIRFSQLPTSGNVAGHMYNINESFTTDSRFEEGAGYSYPSGTNIYWNSHSKWDCLSGALTKFLTQEAYDALPQSVQKNGTIYFVPNSDTEINPGESEYSIPVASPDVLGGVKIGYAKNGRNFPVQLSDEKMYVNVPESSGVSEYFPLHFSTTSNQSITATFSVSNGSITFSADNVYRKLVRVEFKISLSVNEEVPIALAVSGTNYNRIIIIDGSRAEMATTREKKFNFTFLMFSNTETKNFWLEFYSPKQVVPSFKSGNVTEVNAYEILVAKASEN